MLSLRLSCQIAHGRKPRGEFEVPLEEGIGLAEYIEDIIAGHESVSRDDSDGGGHLAFMRNGNLDFFVEDTFADGVIEMDVWFSIEVV